MLSNNIKKTMRSDENNKLRGMSNLAFPLINLCPGKCNNESEKPHQ